MRDVKRIQVIINNFKLLWERNPDFRFGQLVEIIYSKNKVDRFYVEDDWLETRLNELISDETKDV